MLGMLDLRHVRRITAEVQEKLKHRREHLPVFVPAPDIPDIGEAPGEPRNVTLDKRNTLPAERLSGKLR